MTTLPQSFRFSQRTLLIGAGGIMGLICVAAIIFSFSPKETPPVIHTQVVTDKAVKRVFIKDFYKYSDYFTTERQQVTENVLYAFVSKGVPGLYTGIIRQNSFSQTKDSSGAINIKLLVDIHPTNVTYILGVSGTSKDGNRPILIQCAPKDQQKDPSSPCIDGVQRRE